MAYVFLISGQWFPDIYLSYQICTLKQSSSFLLGQLVYMTLEIDLTNWSNKKRFVSSSCFRGFWYSILQLFCKTCFRFLGTTMGSLPSYCLHITPAWTMIKVTVYTTEKQLSGWVRYHYQIYCQTSNKRHTKLIELNVSRLILQLPLSIEARCLVENEDVLHLSYQQFSHQQCFNYIWVINNFITY